MANEPEQRWVWVRYNPGNEFVCNLKDLKDAKDISEDDIKNCLDVAAIDVYMGNQ